MNVDIRIPGLEIRRGRTTVETVTWAVDHVGSGAMVAWFQDPETAFKAATEIADLADWTSPAADLQRQPGLAREVWAVIFANGGSGKAEFGTYRP